MMNINKDVLKAGAIAGGSLGFAAGFMTDGEKLEDSGASTFQQFTGGLGGGLKTGVIGVGAGVGISGTAAALKAILKK